MSEGSTPATDERSSSIWSILPSFDPSVDDPREYVDKVKFLHSICPVKDKAMLAPRLAMLIKGTAWAQIKACDASKLSDPEQGIQVLLASVATWEESAELQTYDKFEKALFRIVQKSDETTMSFVNRLNVAFQDLGEVSLQDMKAFVLLRQSSLQADDKRKVIVMTGGKLESVKIEQAMRSLHTRILGAGGSGDGKKKVYPVNYTEEEPDEIHLTQDDEADEEMVLQAMMDAGDEDAQVILDFEEQLVDVCQESPELSLVFNAYAEARGRLRDKLKSRGFWPARGKGKGGKKGFGGKSFGKKRQSLADRIASSHCRICGQRGHWKWECPKKGGTSVASTNAEVNMALEVHSGSIEEEFVIAPPEPGAAISLNELIYGKQDKSCEKTPPKPPLEFLGHQNGRPGVNDEFICLAETANLNKTFSPVAQLLNVSRLKSCLRHVVGRGNVSEVFRTETCEVVLSSEVGCPGIIDTGASKSVIGQRKVKRLISSLPGTIRSRVQWGKSDTVFRFGNNGTLASVGAVFIPFGDRWMRLEVVQGETPFLLSNAFLKATAADVSSRNHELVFHEHGKKVPLQVNSKGLFTVELSEVLKVFANSAGSHCHLADSCEVVTYTHSEVGVNNQQHTSMSAAACNEIEVNAAAEVAHQSDRSQPPSSHLCDSHVSSSEQPRLRCDGHDVKDGAGAEVPRGSQSELCPTGSSSDPPSSRSDHPQSMGRSSIPRGPGQGKDFQGDLYGRPQVPSFYDESYSPDIGMGSEFPELLPCNAGGWRTTTSDAKGGNQDHTMGCQDRHSTVETRDGHARMGAHGEFDMRADATDEKGAEFRDVRARGHGDREGRGARAAPDGTDCHSSARARCDEEQEQCLGGLTSVTPASGSNQKCSSVSTPVLMVSDVHHQELDRLSAEIQSNLDAMLALSWEVNAPRDKSMSKSWSMPKRKCKLDLLEIYCGEDSRLTEMANKMGLKARRFTMKDGDLSTAEGQEKLWQVLFQEQPRDVWMSPECKLWGNFSRLNLCRNPATRDRILRGRKAEQTHLKLCDEVYEFQVVNGNHFHMEQPQGSEVFEQKVLRDIVCGTLRAEFDMCEVGRLKAPKGNNFLRKRSVVRTTSRELHESLDSRYCKKRHNHQPIEGKIRYLGKWINLSEYAGRYSNGFAKNVCWYLLRSRVSGEVPLEVAELCIEPQVSQEQLAMVGEIKARRCSYKRAAQETEEPSSELPHKTPRKVLLREVFRKVEDRAPRVGTVVLEQREILFGEAQKLCSSFKVTAVEICRGTDRFRLPQGTYDETEIPLRHTFVLHRTSGEVEEIGKPEKWLELPATKRTVKSRPARLCLTVFGRPFSTEVSTSQSSVAKSADSSSPAKVESAAGTKRPGICLDESGDKRHCASVGESEKATEPEQSEMGNGNVSGDVDGVSGDKGDVYAEGYPPRGIAVHGPRFLELSREEKEWLKRVHHRMGHPDPNRFAKFLKDTHADPHIIAGALEFQCDACSETRQGYALARPSAIHSNLGFNEVVGLDKAYWTNDQGVTFGFFHVLDEGTLFHVGRLCADDADAQFKCFEDMWLSWAGPPREVYLDPAAEYCGEVWLTRMQAEDIELKMTAADSHWQLGRVESHGHAIKRMLDRMNAEIPIKDRNDFQKGLRQVFNAKNTMSRVHGYTPEQAVLGFARRLPASILSGESAASHTLAAAEGPDSDRFRQSLELRCSARKAFVEADNCSSLRRALLKRSRPLREPFEVGDWVLYWKKVGGNMRRERGRWYGPARVVVVEGTKVVWLSHASRLIRASPEQLRPASFREWKAALKTEEARHPTAEWVRKAQHDSFFDLGDDVPSAEEILGGNGVDEEVGSLPEPEQVPSTESESGADDKVEVPSSVEQSSHDTIGMVPDPLTAPIPEALPGELSEGDAFFGDTVESNWGYGKVWELDITPEKGVPQEFWDLGKPQCSGEEMVCLVSELRKKRVEVKLKELGEHDQRLFAAAKHKEIGAWLHHKTVRKVAKGRIPEEALMRCRWILNWKSATGDESPHELSSDGSRAKARLVIIGYEDPGIDVVNNDAPTLSKDGRMAVLQTVSSNRWDLVSFDVSTAFLHGRGDGRQLGIHPTPELKEALQMGEGDQCALDGGAYGRIDAPYLWFCEFRDELIKQGCVQCPLDPCVFGLYSADSSGKLRCHGALGVHVDDGIAGGDEKFHAMLKRLESRFKFGSFERKEFKYTGIHFKQWDDYSIEYDQVAYIDKISPISIPKSRRLQPTAEVSEEERTALRSLVGALQFAAVHTRPDLSAKVGELQSAVSKATVADLCTANRVLMEAKQNPMSLMVLPIAPGDVTFCAFSDASFLSNKQNSAHQGTLIFATTPELLANKRAVVAPVAWTRKKIPRVVRSTLGAEAAALCNSIDRLLWIRVLWSWMKNPECDWRQPEKLLLNESTSAVVTDCRSLYDLLTRTAIPQCSEHRTTIECLLIRERLRENCVARWVASQAMLSDCLTKSMDAEVLRECLRSGKYCLRDEDHVLKERLDRRQRISWVKSHGDGSAEKEKELSQEASCLQSTDYKMSPPVHDFWTWGSKSELIRVHRRPRNVKFTPIGISDCPVDIRRLSARRVTDFGNREEHDYWVGTSAYQKQDRFWTGTTKFFLDSF